MAMKMILVRSLHIFMKNPKRPKKLTNVSNPDTPIFQRKSQLNQVVFKIIWLQIGDQTTTTTNGFKPEIVFSVWCSSAVAKYMAGVNIETFPICTFTVQIDKQASICTHQKELQKIILFYYSSI